VEPSGWTTIYDGNYAQLFGRVADGSAADTPALTAEAFDTSRCAIITRWAGGSTTLNVAAYQYNAANGPPGTATFPGVTTTVNGCLILRVITERNDDFGSRIATFPEPDVLYNEDINLVANDHGALAAYKIQTTAGWTYTATVTQSATYSFADLYAYTLALEPGVEIATLVPNPAGMRV
jgi:hypothetical protein